jgi:hypothetical protein
MKSVPVIVQSGGVLVPTDGDAYCWKGETLLYFYEIHSFIILNQLLDNILN